MFINLEDITIQIGSEQLFEHTSWTIGRKQHWAIIGQTGSGKSTLAKSISHNGMLVQGQIQYYFDESNPLKSRPYPEAKEILTLSPETHRDFLAQYANYHQARWQSIEGEDAPTVSDLLTAQSIERLSPFEVSPYPIDEAGYRQKRAHVIALFKLDYLLNRNIIHISHGESRKVFMARLLMQSPKLFIMDDPYSGLDQQSREWLSNSIADLIQQDHLQILFVSSRIEDIPQEIDHLLIVEKGQIIAQGERQTILNRADLQPVFFAPPPNKVLPDFHNSVTFKTLAKKYTTALVKDHQSDSQPIIDMKAVGVTYNQVEILKNINWTIKQGERWALLGHNGAGKTTLLSLILADNPQSYTNDITLFGKERGSGESIWEIKQKIGVVSPELHIYYRKTASCLDVICSGYFDSIGLYHTCSREQMTHAQNWVKVLGMDSLSTTPFDHLSTGQQRLTLLARALVKNPPLLVLDEPCQALDDFHRTFFIHLLNQLCAQTALSLIYVTHHQEEIPSAITHQLKLDHGQIISNGLRA